jgi:hypothetical protein
MAALFLLHRNINNNNNNNERTERVFKERINTLLTCSDKELIKRYRFDRASIEHLCAQLDRFVRPSTARSMAINTEIQVIFHRFYKTNKISDRPI